MKTWLLGEPDCGELLHDRGLTHGLGVFETLLAADGRLVRADLHWERLKSGCARLGIPAPDEKAVVAELEPVVAELTAPRVRVRVMQTAGPGGLRDLSGISPRTVLSVEALGSFSPEITVATSPWPRNEGSPLAGVKCSSYAENLIALDHARRAGVDELIFSNTRGMLCEAATANVFVVVAGRLRTPPIASGCLPGTTRQRVIEWARSLGIEVEERPITMNEARQADGLFLTSSTRGVVRVTEWDERVFPDRRMADLLAEAFERSLKEG